MGPCHTRVIGELRLVLHRCYIISMKKLLSHEILKTDIKNCYEGASLILIGAMPDKGFWGATILDSQVACSGSMTKKLKKQ